MSAVTLGILGKKTDVSDIHNAGLPAADIIKAPTRQDISEESEYERQGDDFATHVMALISVSATTFQQVKT